jgi:hypothetical protein
MAAAAAAASDPWARHEQPSPEPSADESEALFGGGGQYSAEAPALLQRQGGSGTFTGSPLNTGATSSGLQAGWAGGRPRHQRSPSGNPFMPNAGSASPAYSAAAAAVPSSHRRTASIASSHHRTLSGGSELSMPGTPSRIDGPERAIVFQFTAEMEGELSVVPGDRVKVHSEVGGWARVLRVGDRRGGLVPSWAVAPAE